MNIVKTAVAGTLESNDIFITIEPNKGGIVIELDSIVKERFGEQILSSINKSLEQFAVKEAKVIASDRGAISCTIDARMETAILRAKGDN